MFAYAYFGVGESPRKIEVKGVYVRVCALFMHVTKREHFIVPFFCDKFTC